MTASWTALAGDVSVFVLDRDGKPVIDAVVILKPISGKAPAKILPSSVTITQQRMLFLPPMTLVPAGGKINFVNNDPWEHHVKGGGAGFSSALLDDSSSFEFRMDGKVDGKPGFSTEVTVTKPGPVLLGCHIHGSMRGHAYVTDSPWAQVTTFEGQAFFSDVPPGSTTVRVWHADQLIDLPIQSISVGTEVTKVEAKLSVTPRRRRI
ncbi:MAG: plastocyanin [Burkholderiaceae bacterium]